MRHARSYPSGVTRKTAAPQGSTPRARPPPRADRPQKSAPAPAARPPRWRYRPPRDTVRPRHSALPPRRVPELPARLGRRRSETSRPAPQTAARERRWSRRCLDAGERIGPCDEDCPRARSRAGRTLPRWLGHIPRAALPMLFQSNSVGSASASVGDERPSTITSSLGLYPNRWATVTSRSPASRLTGSV